MKRTRWCRCFLTVFFAWSLSLTAIIAADAGYAAAGGNNHGDLNSAATASLTSSLEKENGSAPACSQHPQPARPDIAPFLRTYGQAGNEGARSLIATGGGELIIAGNTDSYAGYNDYYLAKFDAVGANEWTMATDGAAQGSMQSLKATADGGFIGIGYTSHFSGYPFNILVVKYDSAGVPVWARVIGEDAFQESAGDVTETLAGDFIVLGATQSSNQYFDYLLAKLDHDGNLLWTRIVGSNSDAWGQAAKAVTATADGGFIVAGDATSQTTSRSYVVIFRYDADDSLLWSKMYTMTTTEEDNSIAQSLAIAGDNGFLLAGTIYTGNNSYGLALRIDGRGVPSWAKAVLYTAVPYHGSALVSAVVTSDGGFLGVGPQNLYTDPNYEPFYVKYDAQGSMSWAGYFAAPPSDMGDDFFAAQEAGDGGFYIAGVTYGLGIGGSGDIVLLKTDAAGGIPGCEYVAPITPDDLPVTPAPSPFDLYELTPSIPSQPLTLSTSTPVFSALQPCSPVTPTPTLTPPPTQTPSDTPTPPPSDTPSPTPSATMTPSQAPTVTPTPTGGTPALGVRLLMPSHYFSPGDHCWLDAHLYNDGSMRAHVPVFVILDELGAYWFWDSWSTAPAFVAVDVEHGVTVLNPVPDFVFPDTGGDRLNDLVFWGAMTDEDVTQVLGGSDGIGRWTFGYGE